MKIAYLAACALAAAPTFASEPTSALENTAHLNRQSAIEQALVHNKELAAARLMVDRATARVQATGLRPNPSLELEMSDDLLFHDEGESSYGIGISQSFPLANRLAKQKNVSRVEIAKARIEIKRRELDLAKEISDFALDVHLAEVRIEHLSKLRDTLREAASFATNKAETGEISPLDAGQLTLELRILEQDIENLRLEKERLMHQVAPDLGLPSADHFHFDATDTLPYQDQTLPGYQDDILERSPNFQFALLEEKAAEAEIALAQAENWDAITATLFWKNEKGIDEPIGRTSDQLLGLSLSIPLPLKRKGDIRAKEKYLARDQSRLSAAAIRFRIENDVEHAHHEAEISLQRMQAYETEILRFAESQYQETQAAYRAGQVDMLTLLRSQEKRISLEKGYLELYELYAHAILELELARLDIPGWGNLSLNR